MIKRMLPVIGVICIVAGLGIPAVLFRTAAREAADPLIISPGPPLPLSATLWVDLGIVAVIAVLTIGLWLFIGRKYAEHIAGVISLIFGLAGICLVLLNIQHLGVLYWISEYVSLAGLYLGILAIRRNYRFKGSAMAGIMLNLSSLIVLLLFCIIVERCAWISVVMIVVPSALLGYMFCRQLLSFTYNHKRLCLVMGVLAIVLVVVGVLQPWDISSNLTAVIERMQKAAENLQSFSISVTRSDEEMIGPFDDWIDIDYSAPDNYHVKQVLGDGKREFFLIGDAQYYTGSYIPYRQVESLVTGYSSFLFGISLKYWTDYMPDIRRSRDKIVDGTLCLHYMGNYDVEKQMRDFYENNLMGGIQPLEQEEIEERIAELLKESGNIRLEFWIGKDDFLPRQVLYAQEKMNETGEPRVSQILYKFSGFHGEITIDPPFDSEGTLLTGWKSSVPENPAVNEDIHAEVDNYDPSDRKIEYDITLVNSGTDILTDVDVHVASVFRQNQVDSSGIASISWDHDQWTDGPYILEPEESLKYFCTIRYDAIDVEPDMIAGYIRNAYIEVTYFIPGGDQKAEIMRLPVPESIYTLSTELAPELIPRELSIDGEYIIDETGATYTGNGIAGIINGTEYLFLEVNTAGAETPASPGILALDISNKTKPKKKSFTSTDDDTRYVRGLALYGTVLYASIDEDLWILDVSDTSSPRELARLPDFDARQMILSGMYAYINENNNAITTLDLTDPTSPEKVGRLRMQSGSIQMTLKEKYLYAETNETFHIIDTSVPEELAIIHEMDFRASLDEDTTDITYPFYIMSMEMRDNYAYITLSAESTLAVSVLDISEPENPREIAFHRFKDKRFDGPMFISEDKLYVFTTKSHDIERKKRLEILNISDPDNPVETGFYVLPDPWSFFKNSFSGTHQGYRLIDDYLYWFIGNDPNQPVIEILSLK